MADPMTVALAAVGASAGLGWAAYITRLSVEHAKWMSAATIQLANISKETGDAKVYAAAAVVKADALLAKEAIAAAVEVAVDKVKADAATASDLVKKEAQ